MLKLYCSVDRLKKFIKFHQNKNICIIFVHIFKYLSVIYTYLPSLEGLEYINLNKLLF